MGSTRPETDTRCARHGARRPHSVVRRVPCAAPPTPFRRSRTRHTRVGRSRGVRAAQRRLVCCTEHRGAACAQSTEAVSAMHRAEAGNAHCTEHRGVECTEHRGATRALHNERDSRICTTWFLALCTHTPIPPHTPVVHAHAQLPYGRRACKWWVFAQRTYGRMDVWTYGRRRDESASVSAETDLTFLWA